jgi:hypothetical protein
MDYWLTYLSEERRRDLQNDGERARRARRQRLRRRRDNR